MPGLLKQSDRYRWTASDRSTSDPGTQQLCDTSLVLHAGGVRTSCSHGPPFVTSAATTGPGATCRDGNNLKAHQHPVCPHCWAAHPSPIHASVALIHANFSGFARMSCKVLPHELALKQAACAGLLMGPSDSTLADISIRLPSMASAWP